MVMISACLAGKKCRYDGGAKPNQEILARIAGGEKFCLVCPECMGGLPIPREPAEIQGGTGADVLAGRACVISRDGKDVTAAYLAGAQKGLQMAKAKGADTVLLKSKSPSCGAGRIHDGSFSGRLVPGNGVFAELLMQNGIRVLEME
ncbi:MAG: DUF523 domain-containing protein [Clostridiales bacterium]|nr:DUF523 domain-containing protein [Clostridiales bacterium]